MFQLAMFEDTEGYIPTSIPLSTPVEITKNDSPLFSSGYIISFWFYIISHHNISRLAPEIIIFIIIIYIYQYQYQYQLYPITLSHHYYRTFPNQPAGLGQSSPGIQVGRIQWRPHRPWRLCGDSAVPWQLVVQEVPGFRKDAYSVIAMYRIFVIMYIYICIYIVEVCMCIIYIYMHT